MKTAIDYRRTYTNYLICCIEDKINELKQINNMPDGLLEERIMKEDINVEMFKREAKIK